LAIGWLLLLTGCGPADQMPPAPAVEPSANGHSHSHAELGPNGGHLVELGDEDYHVEWTHDDDSGTVTVFVLDSEGKESVAIPAETVSIQAKIQQTTEYQLAAVNRSGDPPTASQFELKDPALIEILKLAGPEQGVEASIRITVNDKLYTGAFERHEHGDGHQH
jgi:hypothetical protein